MPVFFLSFFFGNECRFLGFSVVTFFSFLPPAGKRGFCPLGLAAARSGIPWLALRNTTGKITSVNLYRGGRGTPGALLAHRWGRPSPHLLLLLK